ncbi:hypothetical protein SWPG_00098 [Synechococcus phage S-CBM2]|nr:hypothetical protein SWPG_00098 [Synechococcus phage S-CBM2]
MYIAKKEGIAGSWDYFQDNYQDSPKWTRDKSKAGRFLNPETALKQSNLSGLYDIILEEV